MRRRDVLKLAASSAILAAPQVSRADHIRTLKYVPGVPLSILDPVWSGARGPHIHAYLIFDTLYGLDETFTVQPQMVEGHEVESDGTVWTLKLRDGLRFHDGTPVLARDAVASIKRFATRDGFGGSLMDATIELSAADDRTIRFRLARRFPHLPMALAGCSETPAVIMPERLANTDPFRQVTEMVGSGPYRFLPTEFNAGVRATYERFSRYLPRAQGKPSYTAGPKITNFDRIESQSLGDIATSVAALQRGEVDWLDSVPVDQLPLLARNPMVTLQVTELSGSIPLMRFNQLQPPFDNPAIRRAVLGAIDQADIINVLAGADSGARTDCVGLFTPGSALANDAGIEVLSGPRDYDNVKRELSAAGYRGEPVVVLGVSDNAYFAAISQVGADQLRKAGMNVDLRSMDFTSMIRRRFSKDPPDKGGWNVFFSINDGLFTNNPATHSAIRGDGKSGLPGWSTSPLLEAWREKWLSAADLNEQRLICDQIQLQTWRDVPYIPMGHWVRSTAHRRDIVDLPWGFAAFYSARRV